MAKKLHELLAVEGNLKGQAEKTRADLQNTFEKKRHLFTEKVVTFMPNEEGAQPVTEEQSDLQTTVRRELDWIKGMLAGAMDVSYQVAKGNTIAKADITLDDGTVIAKDVPATALLELEKRVGELHTLVASIPTLDPAKGFRPDPDRSSAQLPGVYKAREEMKTRTKKTQKVVVLYQATPEHPAQTQLVPEDVPVGRIQTQEWSGLVTPSEKGDMLDRVEELRRSVKAARSRANDTEIETTDKVANSLLSYVFGQ